MSDPTTPESVTPETPATPSVAQTLAAEPVAPVVEKKKGRAVGVWSFILGLLTVLGDLAVIIFVAITVFSLLVDLQAAMASGDLTSALSLPAVAGVGILLVVVFFAGFVVAGLGALLGLIALITGRGRVIGVFGLLLSGAALATRIALLTGGLDVGSLGG